MDRKGLAVEDRRAVHRDLGAETAIAEIGPVADFAITDAQDVREPVAGHVGEEDRLVGIGEDQLRTLLLVPALGRPPRWGEARLCAAIRTR